MLDVTTTANLTVSPSVPTVAITSPSSDGAVYPSITSLKGTASAMTGRTLTSVTARVYRPASGAVKTGYLLPDGTWSSTYSAANELAAHLVAPNWSVAIPVLPDGQYQVRATATDSAGKTATTAYRPFWIEAVPPTISVNNVTLTEGNTGSTNANFVLSLSRPSGRTITVKAQTSSGLTNSASSATDYTPLPSTTFTFAPGETTKTIGIPVLGDTLDELDETFRLVLSSPVNATLTNTTGVCTILDNDATPSLRISDATITEGDSGSALASFTVTLSAASGQLVSVNYANADATAQAGSDYVAVSGTLAFTSGQTTKVITVPVLGDKISEGNETFQVLLSGATNATIADGTGLGTIVDNEGLPVISINKPSVTEGDVPLNFQLTLSNPSSKPVSVTFATANAAAPRATAGEDYQSVPPTVVTFAPGEVSKTMSVSVLNDDLDEDNESVGVSFSAPLNATLASATGVGTINDDDPLPSLSISDVSVTEGNSGVTSAIFKVTLSARSGRSVSINYSTLDGTAQAGSDYQSLSGTLTFAPGDNEKSIVVSVLTDKIREANETFSINLSGGVNAGITKGTGKGTILNDDSATGF